MPDFGSFRGFGDKLVQGQTPTQLGLIGSFDFAIDVDAQLFFDRVSAAGGTLTNTEKTATNQLVLDLKSTSIWSLLPTPSLAGVLAAVAVIISPLVVVKVLGT